MNSSRHAGVPWYRSELFRGGGVYAAGFCLSSGFFFGDSSLHSVAARTCFFLIALPFLTLGIIPGLTQSLTPFLLALLCAVYFPLVYFGSLKLRDSLSMNRAAVLGVFIVLLLGLHGMADRLLGIYIGESIKNTADYPAPAPARLPAAAETLLEQAIKEEEAAADLEGIDTMEDTVVPIV